MIKPTFEKVILTTDGAGNATGFTLSKDGRLFCIHYDKTSFEDTVDFVITAENDGTLLWSESNVTASKSVYPTCPIHNQIGVEIGVDYCFVFGDRIKIKVSNGGNERVGTFLVGFTSSWDRNPLLT